MHDRVTSSGKKRNRVPNIRDCATSSCASPNIDPEFEILALKSFKPCFADVGNYLVQGEFPPNYSKSQKDKIKREAQLYVWDDPYLWRHCVDKIIQRCLPDNEVQSILTFCHSHSCWGHFGANKTARKVLEAGFYWPTIFRDVYTFCKACD